MSLMPTLLMGIWRVSACPCTSSTGFACGFFEGTATFIWVSYWSDSACHGAETAYLKNFRPFGRIWLKLVIGRPGRRSNSPLNQVGGQPRQYLSAFAQGRQPVASAALEFARPVF